MAGTSWSSAGARRRCSTRRARCWSAASWRPESAAPRLVAGGTALATSTFDGLGVRGIDPGARVTTLDTSYGGGERWSVDGRVLARVRFTEGITFTTFPGAPTGDILNVDVANSAIGAGIGIVDSSLSPDGSTLAVLAATDRAQLPDDPDGAATDGPVDVLLIDSATGVVRPLGSHELGAGWPAPTWSSDGSRFGIVAGASDGTLTGWVVDVGDATERSFPIGAASAAPTGIHRHSGRHSRAGRWQRRPRRRHDRRPHARPGGRHVHGRGRLGARRRLVRLGGGRAGPGVRRARRRRNGPRYSTCMRPTARRYATSPFPLGAGPGRRTRRQSPSSAPIATWWCSSRGPASRHSPSQRPISAPSTTAPVSPGLESSRDPTTPCGLGARRSP